MLYLYTWGTGEHVFFFLLIVFYMCSESYFLSLSNFYKYHQRAKLFTYSMKMKKEWGTEISGNLRCYLT